MRNPFVYISAGVATILIPILGILGLFYALVWSLERAFTDMGSTTNILVTAASPDQKNIATSYVNMGGGAAGWCSTSVNLRRSDEEMNVKDYVFSSHCGTKIELVWESNDILRISYTPDSENFGIFQKRWNTDNSIRILYSGK